MVDNEELLDGIEDDEVGVHRLVEEIEMLAPHQRGALLADLVVRCRRKTALLEMAQSLGRHLSLEPLFREVITRASQLLKADRATLFLIDFKTQELWSRVAQGLLSEEIRFPRDRGIAGHVATTGEILEIPDAYQHPLFNPAIDKETGYHTRSILCAPIRGTDGRVIGVLQAINHVDGVFGDNEIAMADGLCPVLGLLLEHAGLYEVVVAREKEVQALLDVATALGQSLKLGELVSRIMALTSQIMDADRSTLFLIDEERRQLWSKVAQGLEETEIRIPMDQGIAGHVARTGETLNIPDAYQHELFNPEVDRKTGYRTRTILAHPLRDSEGKVFGVTQVINRRDGAFGPDDERRLDAFSAQAAVCLENARLYDRVRSMKEYLESILRSVTDGVVTVDTDGRLTTINLAAQRLFKTRAEGAVGKDKEELFGSRNEEILELIARVQESGEPGMRYDIKVEVVPGVTASVNLNVVPLIGAEDKKLGVVVVLEDITREKRIKSNLSRYMSKELVEQVIKSGELALGGTRQEATILFSDIRSFTSLTEGQDAGDVVVMLNEYFSYMVDAVFKFGGVLDKYIGDAIMAVFGVPFADPVPDAIAAVKAALEMNRQLVRLNEERAGRGHAPIRIGIGISTGEVLSGNIGSSKRMEYTVIGDGVNLASRLESATKQYGGQLMISEYTLEKIGSQFVVRDLDTIRVKGKQQQVRVYEVICHQDEPLSDAMREILAIHERAIELYRHQSWGRALKVFRDGLEAHPEDRVFQIYAQRCSHFLEQPPDPDWSGVWTLTEK